MPDVLVTHFQELLAYEVWANDTESGTRYNVTVSRLYKDQEQQWCTSESFGRDDLLLLAKVADLAHSWISEQMQGSDVPF